MLMLGLYNVGHTVFCNVHFVLEFGQFISVTWINLLREAGIWSKFGPNMGVCVFIILNEPSLTQSFLSN